MARRPDVPFVQLPWQENREAPRSPAALALAGPVGRAVVPGAYIDAHAQPGDALFLNPGAGAATLDLYLQTPLPREGYPQRCDPQVSGYVGETATPERVEARFGVLAGQSRRIWLVECCMPTFWDPQRHIPAWLEEWGHPLPVPSFPGLEVRLYQAR